MNINWDLVGFLFFLLALLSMLLGTYYIGPMYSGDCLESYANTYCENVNGTLGNRYTSTFYCESEDINFRLQQHKSSIKFYFLEEELNECMIKEGNSFKKVNK